jgi:hypothetical protein
MCTLRREFHSAQAVNIKKKPIKKLHKSEQITQIGANYANRSKRKSEQTQIGSNLNFYSKKICIRRILAKLSKNRYTNQIIAQRGHIVEQWCTLVLRICQR